MLVHVSVFTSVFNLIPISRLVLTMLLACPLGLTGKALRQNGLGDGEYVETVAGGLGANSEAPIDRMYDMATEDKSGVDDGTLSRVSRALFSPLPLTRHSAYVVW